MLDLETLAWLRASVIDKMLGSLISMKTIPYRDSSREQIFHAAVRTITSKVSIDGKHTDSKQARDSSNYDASPWYF